MGTTTTGLDHGYRLCLCVALLLAAMAARADVGDDLLGKVPPPPKTVDEAKALCGEGVSNDSNVWNKFEKQRQAADDQFENAMKAKMSDPKTQSAMMAQQTAAMSDPSYIMGAQQYAQYMAGVAGAAPASKVDALLTPAYASAKDQVDGILKTAQAKIAKCPTRSGEGGTFPIPSCEKPIDADSARQKNDAVDKYLATVGKSWPQFVVGTKDYFKQLDTVPDGVDPSNFQVKMQRDSIPGQKLGALKDVAQASQDICGKATGLATQFNPSN